MKKYITLRDQSFGELMDRVNSIAGLKRHRLITVLIDEGQREFVAIMEDRDA